MKKVLLIISTALVFSFSAFAEMKQTTECVNVVQDVNTSAGQPIIQHTGVGPTTQPIAQPIVHR